MSYIEIKCGDVLASVVFIIEGELNEIPHADAISNHITTCAPCAAEIEHERAMHQMLQDVLKRSCNEQALKISMKASIASYVHRWRGRLALLPSSA